MEQILIVEDDTDLAQGIALSLKKEGVVFQFAKNRREAEETFREGMFSLLLLDINLPDGSGLELCEKIRKQSQVPIIFLTANDMEYDEVAGFEAGADDYITKPFSLAVLRARVNAVMRRRKEKENGRNIYRRADFCFSFDEMRFFIGEEEIILSKTEQRVLKILTANAGHVVSREVLLNKVWCDSGEFVDENALSVVIRRLRGKLDKNGKKPAIIKTVYGIGYMWEEV